MIKKILVSNGSYRFHLAPLAAELCQLGYDVHLLVAAWPYGWQKRIASLLPATAQVNRFLDRAEHIHPKRVSSIPFVEIVLKAGDLLAGVNNSLFERIHCIAYFFFGCGALLEIFLLRPSLYHYRCCYGGLSVRLARYLGVPAICDHSIAHPYLIDHLVDSEGSYPLEKHWRLPTIGPFLSAMADDISKADYLLVNSDFVKKTCVTAGISPQKIFVVYQGVDKKFLDHIDSCENTERTSNALLYAGGWQRRKGVQTLVHALSDVVHPFRLSIAGGMEFALRKDPATATFFYREDVNYHGNIPRPDLAQLMCATAIFVFPSYCEGSARVVFEALAAGCFVITTPNSGSIVEDRIHGLIVPPGDSIALSNAIDLALSDPAWVRRLGYSNARLIRSEYSQSSYCSNVLSVYRQVLSASSIAALSQTA